MGVFAKPLETSRGFAKPLYSGASYRDSIQGLPTSDRFIFYKTLSSSSVMITDLVLLKLTS